MRSPKGIYVIDITGFAAPLYLVVEVWLQIPDLMLEAYAAYLAVVGLTVVVSSTGVVARSAGVVAYVQSVVGSLKNTFAVMDEVDTAVHLVAPPWLVAACVHCESQMEEDLEKKQASWVCLY